MVRLAFAFAAAWSITSAMAGNLPRILESLGAMQAPAVAAGALIGPAQVAAQIAEASLLKRFHPLWSARLACITHSLGACLVWLFGGSFAGIFAVLYGGGNGILTFAPRCHSQIRPDLFMQSYLQDLRNKASLNNRGELISN